MGIAAEVGEANLVVRVGVERKPVSGEGDGPVERTGGGF